VDILRHDKNGKIRFYGHCYGCGSKTGYYPYYSEAENAWNNSTNQGENTMITTNSLLDELEKELEFALERTDMSYLDNFDDKIQKTYFRGKLNAISDMLNLIRNKRMEINNGTRKAECSTR